MKKPTSSIAFQKNWDQRLHRVQNFSAHANQLRKTFDLRFSNPHEATSDRFCWDYWTVPGQYQLLRTPAEAFFGTNEFRPFLEALTHWGRTHLGCQMVSHPWLSTYVEGSYQALHSDVPHGPWSFVYSLTPWKKRKFSGGQTLVAKPQLLRHFQELKSDQSQEFGDFFDRIEPQFNQLTLFDPRYPHGVETVRGAESVTDGRLVIHGWFTDPRPSIEGALTVEQISEPLDALANHLIETLEPTGHTGLLSIRFQIAGSGEIKKTEILCGHLVDELAHPLSRSMIHRSLKLASLQFPKAKGPSTLTLPIEFRA